MSRLFTLALTNTTDQNAGYNEATELARAATMEAGGAVLREEYTFEEYIARRGNFINKLPEYKHLPNACWVVRKHTADLIFDSEAQHLSVREVRRRELANEVVPLLPLPTTANTATIDNFATCRPEGEWYAKTPGGSSPHTTPATSPIEGGLALEARSLASGAGLDSSPLIAGHADFVAAVQPSGRASARSVGFDFSDANQPASQDQAIILPSITVTNDEQPVSFQQDTSIESIDRLRLSADYNLKAATTSGNQNEVNTANNGAVLPDPKMPTDGQAQAAPAAILPESGKTLKTSKVNWKELSTWQPQAELTTPPVPVGIPKSSPAKVTVFTPDPRVSSMARYGIVAPIKNKQESKTAEQSALKSAAKLATKPAVKPAMKPATLVAIAAAPEPTSRSAPPTARAITPSPKSSSTAASIESAAKRLKGTRGVAQPVKTPTSTATKNKQNLTKSTPTPSADSPSTALSKTARRLASIIAGTSLPKTKAEARAAATEHHSRLLAAHSEQQTATQPDPKDRRKSARTLQKANAPDLMPFFFSRPIPNTDKKGGEEEDFIRCICGIQHDDGENMICCEACEVWQHSACVVPGLTEGKLEALKWECTNCDPWGNREVLKGLRVGAKAKEELKVQGNKRKASGAL